MKFKLKRCPFCNGHNLQMEHSTAVSWVRCRECGATGPEAVAPPTAVEEWNNGERGSTSLVNLPPGESNRNDLKVLDLDV